MNSFVSDLSRSSYTESNDTSKLSRILTSIVGNAVSQRASVTHNFPWCPVLFRHMRTFMRTSWPGYQFFLVEYKVIGVVVWWYALTSGAHDFSSRGRSSQQCRPTRWYCCSSTRRTLSPEHWRHQETTPALDLMMLLYSDGHVVAASSMWSSFRYSLL